jgi:hypothetical protein
MIVVPISVVAEDLFRWNKDAMKDIEMVEMILQMAPFLAGKVRIVVILTVQDQVQREDGKEITGMAEAMDVVAVAEEVVEDLHTEVVLVLRVEERMEETDRREIHLMIMDSKVKRAKKLVIWKSHEKCTLHQNLLLMTQCLLEVLVLV